MDIGVAVEMSVSRPLSREDVDKLEAKRRKTNKGGRKAELNNRGIVRIFSLEKQNVAGVRNIVDYSPLLICQGWTQGRLVSDRQTNERN